MAVTINGSTGIAGVDGSAGTPAVQGGDTNTGIFFPAADTVAIATGGTERARVDSSGNVGIATTSPQAKLHAVSTVTLTNDATYPIIAGDATTGGKRLLLGYAGAGNGYGVIQAVSSGVAWTDLVVQPNGGNLLVGTTASVPTADGISLYAQANNYQIIVGHSAATGSGVSFVNFRYNNGSIGSITQNGTTAVAYNTSSDYRLKHDIAPMTGALARVAALKPVTYKWNADDSDGEGFIAHELAEVVPDAVTGEKDAVDEEGKPIYQGIDTSFLVATLTAAIQEQQALITSLTARIAALEGAAQ